MASIGYIYDRRKARRLVRKYGGYFWRVCKERGGRVLYQMYLNT